jgi:hypothetical protein
MSHWIRSYHFHPFFLLLVDIVSKVRVESLDELIHLVERGLILVSVLIYQILSLFQDFLLMILLALISQAQFVKHPICIYREKITS